MSIQSSLPSVFILNIKSLLYIRSGIEMQISVRKGGNEFWFSIGKCQVHHMSHTLKFCQIKMTEKILQLPPEYSISNCEP